MKIAGPRTWRKWERDAENLPCESCAKRGVMHVRGIHDVENVNSGKPVHDPENFRKFVSEVNVAAEKAGIDPTKSENRYSSSLRDPLNTESGSSPNRRSMATNPLKGNLKGPIVAGYGGSLLAYGIELGIDTAASTFPAIIPGVGPKSLLNLVAAVGFAAVGYKMKHKPMISTLSWVASAHHVTKIVELVRTGGFPTQFVRPAPFTPVQAQQVQPTFQRYGSGGAALF